MLRGSSAPPLGQSSRDDGRRFVGSGDHPPFPNRTTAHHGLFPPFPTLARNAWRRPGGGQPDLSSQRRTMRPRFGRSPPLFDSVRRLIRALSQCLPRPHARIEVKIRAVAPLFWADGDPGFPCARGQATRIGSPLIQLWNTELIPGRLPPSFRAVAPQNIRAITP
jgi:hypothetical protein